MRAMTITQPFAGLIAAKLKLVENRPRSIVKREDFGNPFAIHASREIDERIYKRLAETAPDICPAAFATFDPEAIVPPSMQWYRLSRITSAVIAIATIDRVILTGPNGELDTTDYDSLELIDQLRWTFGPVVYVLRDVVALRDPVACKGMLGFWTLPGDLEAKVLEQIGAGR